MSFREFLLFADDELESYLNADKPPRDQTAPSRRSQLEALFPHLLTELRKVGVTRQLLWQEYIRDYPGGFQYSRFCELLQEHILSQRATMHFEHEPGSMLQVDFAGDMLHYVDPVSGEPVACPVFVAVLP